MPEISVIVPAYNAARTVGATVDSVLAQTFDDFELIVIDDGSRDDTAEVATRDDSRVTVVRTENGGVSAARNRGLEQASGAYIAFLDADDLWHAEKLARQHAALQDRPDAGVCFGSADIVDDALASFGTDPAVHRDDYTEALLLEGNIVPGGGSGVLARTSAVARAGRFDTALSQCADWDQLLRLSTVAKFLPLEEPLVRYRSVVGSMSSDPALLERDTMAMLDKFFASPAAAPYQRLRRRAFARQRMVCAGSYLHARLTGDALRCFAAALRDDPRAAGLLAGVPIRWADRARRRVLGLPPSDRDALSRRV
jgi:glycosyltransferase involved in cell wall biosynthesis